MRIDIVGLTKHFGATSVLDNVDIHIREREFLGLLGPSGSGKTTLLRILAGLEYPDAGRVLVDDQDLLAQSVQARQIGFVFQHYALFGHMTVFDNVAFGLRVRRRSTRPKREEIEQRVKTLLDLVQLKGFDDRFPAQLSGGQRQRVALARALAVEPKVLLLDEPFGALDAKVRVELRRWLREIHDTTGLTTVFVTHDQEEALDLADRVAIMRNGHIEQVGTPAQIYEDPKTPFVYDFLGRTNAFDCEVKDGHAKLGDKLLPVDGVPEGPAVAFVRPHDVLLSRPDDAAPSEDVTLPGTAMVRFMSQLGPRASVELLLGRRLIEAHVSREVSEALELEVGGKCVVHLRLPRVYPKSSVGDIKTTPVRPTAQATRLLRRRRQAATT